MTRGLLVDYGGVLTTGVGRSFRAFERSNHMPRGSLLELLQAAYRADAEDSAIARFERGEMELTAFEAELGRQLGEAGYPVTSTRLVDRVDRNVEIARRLGMYGVVHRDAETTAADLSAFLGVPLGVGH